MFSVVCAQLMEKSSFSPKLVLFYFLLSNLLLSPCSSFTNLNPTKTTTTSNLFSDENLHYHVTSKTASSLLMATKNASGKKATLDEKTTWKLRFALSGIRTVNNKRLDNLFLQINGQFLEEDGYEPPQGFIKQILPSVEIVSSSSSDDGAKAKTIARTPLELSSSRWMLSEDPEDRQFGLWIWGLFKEPLYPFMLLEIETKEMVLPGKEEDKIGPLKLFAQVTHIRDNDAGVVLKDCDLNVKEIETVNADPFGASKIELFEYVSIGQISFQPTVS
mmetsp:Transcript_25843/g.31677  ORF Transcript_25843/g.31677 Transcript_25843/m.31677 type:complete len:275 (-) Transcript_25843:1371-2195(-)